MPKYLFQGSYTRESWAGMVDAPEDRTAQTRRLVENAGGKLETYYWAFGADDFLAIAELPDDAAAGAVSIAASSSGALSGIKTTKLITPAEGEAMLRAAGRVREGYHPAGGGGPRPIHSN